MTSEALFKHAGDLSRAHAADCRIVTFEGGALGLGAERVAIGYWTYAFYPNECSRYHSAIRFKGERCPACKALAMWEDALDKIESINEEREIAEDGERVANERLREISRRRH